MARPVLYRQHLAGVRIRDMHSFKPGDIVQLSPEAARNRSFRTGEGLSSRSEGCRARSGCSGTKQRGRGWCISACSATRGARRRRVKTGELGRRLRRPTADRTAGRAQARKAGRLPGLRLGAAGPREDRWKVRRKRTSSRTEFLVQPTRRFSAGFLAAARGDLVANLGTFVQRAKARSLDCGNVHEHILAAAVRLNETVSFGRVKPLRSSSHVFRSSIG